MRNRTILGYPNKTETVILGFHFYITWSSTKEGLDQFGNRWLNRKKPYPEDTRISDICLDTYNEVSNLQKQVKKNSLSKKKQFQN